MAAARAICVKSRPMDETWQSELREFIAIPSVSAEPAHRDDVKRAGEWVCDFIRRIGGTAELTPFGDKELALGEIPASHDPASAPTVLCYGHFDVQPPAPARALGDRPVRAHDQGRMGVCARHHRRQGAALHPLEGGAEARRGRTRSPSISASPATARRRSGATTIVDYLANDDGRRERRRHLRRRHAAPGSAGVRSCDARPDRLRRQGQDGRARPALRHVRRRSAECDPRARRGSSTRCIARQNGLLPDPLRQGIAAPTDEELNAWRALPPGAEELSSQGARPLDAARRRPVLHANVRRAVRRRERHHRRQARASKHDALGEGLGRDHDPPRARPGPEGSAPRQSG